MSSFNLVVLMGNLTRDPVIKNLPSNTTVCEFGLAMNRKFRTQAGEDREEVTFVDCTAFGKTAELIGEHFHKGKPIHIEGRLKYDSWEDKQGGGRHSKLSVAVSTFQFIGGRDEGGGDRQQEQPRQQSRQRQPAGRQQRQPQPEPPFSENQEFKEDDIPF